MNLNGTLKHSKSKMEGGTILGSGFIADKQMDLV
jgi:hypothetical protein